MIDVVSVSLGGEERDRAAVLRIGGEAVRMRRIGCNGSYLRAAQVLAELDGKVGAIGLGGLNFAYRLGRRSWPMPGTLGLRRAVRRTPLVDGSLVKDEVEPKGASALGGGGRALVVSMLDRPAAVSALVARGYEVRVGDAHFALGMPLWPSPRTFAAIAPATMPFLRRLPRSAVYGPRAAGGAARGGRWDVIWGDVQLLRRHPVCLRGTRVVCGSLRTDDAKWLRDRGASALIAPTPVVRGEVFGANVWEAVLAAICGRELGAGEVGPAWMAVLGDEAWVNIV